MNRDVCEHFNPVDLPCDKCKWKAMNLEDIIRMAREAGLVPKWLELCPKDEEALFRFAALVAAAEREECAKLCDERKHYWQRDDIRRHEDEHCAAAIRARGNT